MARGFEMQTDVTMLSPFKSERSSWPPKLIVLHATDGHNYPGVEDLKSLGEWFRDPSAGVSCHVATDAEGHSARYVLSRDKAWHCAAFNGVSLGIEQVGFGSQTSWPTAQLKETAKWIAYWSIHYGIPIRKGYTLGSSVVRSGVVRHSSLGRAGGDHDDPGTGYDLHRVLEYARWYKIHGWIS